MCSGAKSVSVASSSASGAQTKVAMSSPSAENFRRRIEGNSSAIRFGVVHLGSQNMEFEECPAVPHPAKLVPELTGGWRILLPPPVESFQ